jgi:hypothetical protein
METTVLFRHKSIAGALQASPAQGFPSLGFMKLVGILAVVFLVLRVGLS